MVSFSTAMAWLRDGEKVTRPCWEEKSYWTLGVDEMICWADGKPARIHLEQFNARDWKIHRKRSFNLSSKEIPIGTGFFAKSNVKEFVKVLKGYNKNRLMGSDFVVISFKNLNDIVGKNLI